MIWSVTQFLSETDITLIVDGTYPWAQIVDLQTGKLILAFEFDYDGPKPEWYEPEEM